jgi:hypothetical protein
LLLPLFINDLPDGVKSDVCLFADDTGNPDNFLFLNPLNIFPDNLYLNSSVFSTLAIFICLHFSGWNFSNQVLFQFSRFSKSSHYYLVFKHFLQKGHVIRRNLNIPNAMTFEMRLFNRIFIVLYLILKTIWPEQLTTERLGYKFVTMHTCITFPFLYHRGKD